MTNAERFANMIMFTCDDEELQQTGCDSFENSITDNFRVDDTLIISYDDNSVLVDERQADESHHFTIIEDSHSMVNTLLKIVCARKESFSLFKHALKENRSA